jgi:radical SAM protein with 4Fe4S-binding SPASM domain
LSSSSLWDLEQKARAQLIPLGCAIELTHRCNLMCSHCYMSGLTEPDPDVHDIENLVTELALSGTLELELTGGEPMLHPGFFSIVEKARESNMALSLITNGTLLDRDAARRIAESGFLRVCVSLNGRRRHDEMAGVQGAHKLSMRAVELLRQEGVRVTVKFLATRQNWRDVDDIREFCRVAGASFEPTPLVFANVTGSGSVRSLRLTAEELAGYYAKCVPAQSAAPDKCGAGISSCAVSPGGKVLPCQTWRQEAGSLREESFQRIWRDSTLFNWIRNLPDEAHEACCHCTIKESCPVCPGMAYSELGNALLASPYSCICASAHRGGLENGRKETV